MNPVEVADVLGAPLKVNTITLGNRIVMGPMAAHHPNPDGGPSEQTIAYFAARARGGVGMIILGGLRLFGEDIRPGLKRLVDTIHAENVPVVGELVPGLGRMVPPGGRLRGMLVGPRISASPIEGVIVKDRLPRGLYAPRDIVRPMPREATIEEIQQTEGAMIASAADAHRAGLDGVEIAAHMSYFAASFLTPRTNWRTDEYGGSVENRARMLVNIVSAIRKNEGPGFVVGLRITSNEYLPDGQGPDGYVEIARKVEAAGADYVALSPGHYETMDVAMSDVDGLMVDNGDSHLFKQGLSAPVFLQGLHDPARAAKAIAEGKGDVIMLGRPLLADPDYARKVLEGRPDAIVKCERDNYCMRRFFLGMPIRCEVNPALGLEDRGPAGPPLGERLRKPAEEALLRLTGSRTLMGFAGALAGRRSRHP